MAMVRRRANCMSILAVACAVVLGLVGCSGNEPTQSTPSPDALQPTMSPQLVGLPPAKPAKLLKSGDTVGLTSMPWVLTSISHERDSITVAYVAGDGDCFTPVGFLVQQHDESIEVSAVSRQGVGPACADKLVLGRATIDLPKALTTGVTLLHAPVARAWDNPHFFS
jgi:hypothetical protein